MAIERFTLRDINELLGNPPKSRNHAFPAFDEADVVPVEAPPPVLTQDDLKASEQEGYRRGFLDGEREGRASAETDQSRLNSNLETALSTLVSQVGRVIEDYNAFVAEQKTYLPNIALAVAQKVAGDAITGNPLPLITSIVASCVDALLGEPHVVITVKPELADALEEKLKERFSRRKDPGEISIVGDDSLGISDCRIEWQHGLAKRDSTALWQGMEKIISDMADAARREPPAISTSS